MNGREEPGEWVLGGSGQTLVHPSKMGQARVGRPNGGGTLKYPLRGKSQRGYIGYHASHSEGVSLILKLGTVPLHGIREGGGNAGTRAPCQEPGSD